MPFVVRADFNGDGTLDEAWLLPTSSATGWGLFAAFGSAKGPRRFVRLEQDRSYEAQLSAGAVGGAGRRDICASFRRG